MLYSPRRVHGRGVSLGCTQVIAQARACPTHGVPIDEDFALVVDLLMAATASNSGVRGAQEGRRGRIKNDLLKAKQFLRRHALVALQLSEIALFVRCRIGTGHDARIRKWIYSHGPTTSNVGESRRDPAQVIDSHRSVPHSCARGDLNSICEASVGLDNDEARVCAKWRLNPEL
jgi:hypothetical protein